MSADHVLPRGLLRHKGFTVSGLADDERHVGLNSLVANCLCRRHNQELSELDQTAIDFMNAFREVMRLTMVRTTAKKRRWSPKTFTVDGVRFQRAQLKFAATVAAALAHQGVTWSPPPEMVEMIFGLREVPPEAGLVGYRRLDDTPDEEFGLGLLSDGPGLDPFAVVFEAFSLLGFVTSWKRTASEVAQYQPLQGREPAHRIYEYDSGNTALRLRLDWKVRPRCFTDPAVAALRAKYKDPMRGLVLREQ